MNIEEFRIERDSIGEVQVPMDRYYGAQTQRSFENFRIGNEKMPVELIRSIALVKQAAAKANYKTQQLPKEKFSLIQSVCNEILTGDWEKHFPLSVWQTGSGTQTNMNVNEVIANRGNEIAGRAVLHPNDDVNLSQSSNDVFPTAMHIAVVSRIVKRLIPVLHAVEETLLEKEREYEGLIKTGRTHLQDATPIALSQEISGWRASVHASVEQIKSSLTFAKRLALGGTAVGTGINAGEEYAKIAVEELSQLTGIDFVEDENKFHALASKDGMVVVQGALKGLAANLMKMANDIRWMASGPRCGLGELELPANEPGSSIMPGKVNPTQAEALTMVCVQVFGYDAAVGFAASQGNFQLNVYMPLIAYNVLNSIKLLADATESFRVHALEGMRAVEKKLTQNVEQSLMNITALNRVIGYDKGAQIVKKAYEEGTTLKHAALELGFLTEEEYDIYMDPRSMV